jgi:membrane associated rhomboid family serine protease
MFIFLGLHARPTHFAWMSFLILILTCAYSIYSFDGLEQNQMNFQNRTEFKEARFLREQLAISFCNLHKLERSSCLTLKAFASSEALFDIHTLREIYAKTMQSNVGLREASAQDQGLGFFDLIEFGPTDQNTADFEDQTFVQLYNRFSAIYYPLEQDYKSYLKSNHLLSQMTMTPFNLLRANFLHAGWVHLIGNMLFFIFFAVFIESRLGSFFTLVIYLVGGSIGMLIQAKYFLPASVHLLGASGCVSAILGAALALFWRQKIKVLLTFLFYNKILFIPGLIALPLLSLAQDIAGALDPTSHVGHIAHLGGFCSGFVIAKIFAELNPVQKEFIFIEEQQLYSAFQKTEDFDKKFNILKKLLRINPENEFVLEEATAWAIRYMKSHDVPEKEKIIFLSEMISRHIQLKLQKENPDQIVRYLTELPTRLTYSKIFEFVPLSLQMRVQESWLSVGRFKLCMDRCLVLEKRISKNSAQTLWNEILTAIQHASFEDIERDELADFVAKRSLINSKHIYLSKIRSQIHEQKAAYYAKSS